MGIEDQKEEREVLDSIFPEEITDISDTAYRIAIALDIYDPNHDPDDTENAPPTILLHVSYPPNYPDVAPDLDISSPPNAVRHPLLDVAEDKAHLLSSLQSSIEESLGMAMIFTLVATLKESAEALIGDRLRQAQEAKDVEAQKAEEEENRKFHGTAVTIESFLAWRTKFKAEMEEKERREKEEMELDEKKRRIKVEEKKMTGRKLWESGLVGKIDEDDMEAEGEDAIAGIERLKAEG